MRKLTYVVAAAVVAAGFVALPAYASHKAGHAGGASSGGSPASFKAAFGTNYTGVTFTEFSATVPCDGTGFDEPNAVCTAWYPLFNTADALKTSSQGAIEVVVSMECSIWTSSSAVAEIVNTGSGGARAGVEIRVKIDGVIMEPGTVVYCDRLQFLQLTIPALFAGVTPVTSTDPFVVSLFQRTKSAHGYHFYVPTPPTDLHDVLVEVRGIVQCSKDGAAASCKDAGLDEVLFFDETIQAGTMVAIGKSTLVVEEHQNWGVF